MKIQRITLIGEYLEHRANWRAGPCDDRPSPRIVAGYCLQYPAPFHALDNLKLPFGTNADKARDLIRVAMEGTVAP